jgi:hypothetical protein
MADRFYLEGLKAASETTKQIITLATGIVALTVTFAREFTGKDTALVVPYALKLAWVAYGVSVAFGILTLMAITGSLNAISMGENSPDAMAPNIRIPSLIMLLAFFVAFVLTIIAGFSVVHG